MNDIIDYDPLSAIKGQSNSAMAKAAILREKIRADKAAEEASRREKLEGIRAKNTGVLKEIALVLGVPHDIEEYDECSYLFLRKVCYQTPPPRVAKMFSSNYGYLLKNKNNQTFLADAIPKYNEKYRDVIQTAQEGGYTKIWLKRYWHYKTIDQEIECKYETIYPERHDYFLNRSYMRQLKHVLAEIQEETVKMLAEEV